jgi:hypothetical protein
MLNASAQTDAFFLVPTFERHQEPKGTNRELQLHGGKTMRTFQSKKTVRFLSTSWCYY